ncbi:MAG: hypothetical protein P4M14_13330 [Gammaproteobacteria bacterium]|nr:hypothetical protein [Gammaproteobacteria bacterium]
MTPRQKLITETQQVISQLSLIKAQFKQFKTQEFEMKKLLAASQEVFVLANDTDNNEFSAQQIEATSESIQEAGKLATGLLTLTPTALAALDEEKLIIFLTAIKEHLEEAKSTFSPEEEHDEDEEEQKIVAQPASTTVVSVSLSSSSATSYRPSVAYMESDILGLSILREDSVVSRDQNAPMEAEEMKAEENQPITPLTDIINSIIADIVLAQKGLAQTDSAIKKQNADIQADIDAYTLRKKALVEEEKIIAKNLFKSKKHRAKHPEQIKICSDKIRDNQSAHHDNLQSIRTIELRIKALQTIIDKLNALNDSLLSYQVNSKTFDHDQCNADLLEIKDNIGILLNQETSPDEKSKAAKEIFDMIGAMLLVHAPAKDRKSAAREGLQSKSTSPDADQLQANENKDDIQLLLAAILKTQHKMQPTMELFRGQLENPQGFPLARGRLDDLNIINSNLNNIVFCLRAHPYAAFYDFAREEYPSFPLVFNAPQYLRKLRNWADINSDLASEILANELKAEVKVQDPPKKTSFLQQIWRNKFFILGTILGCAGGVALGIFTFGLGTSGLAAIATYVAAVGSSGIGGASTNGIFGWIMDRWLEPVDEIPPLPEVRHEAKADENDDVGIEINDDTDDEDDIAPSPRHDEEQEQKLPPIKRLDVRVSESRLSFQHQSGTREAKDYGQDIANGYRSARPGLRNP